MERSHKWYPLAHRVLRVFPLLTLIFHFTLILEAKLNLCVADATHLIHQM